MKPEKINYQTCAFKAAYINIHSLNQCSKGKKEIIRALKENNTPLRKFIKETLNTEKNESIIGDVFINFEKNKKPYEGDDFFDIIRFTFPKIKEQKISKFLQNLSDNQDKKSYKYMLEHKKEFIKELSEKTDFMTGFRDYDYRDSTEIIIGNGFQDGAKQLSKYLKGKEIVEDLKEHIAKLLTKK